MADIVDPVLLAAFLDEADENLATVARLFVDLEHHPNDRELVEAIFRPIHSLKGNAPFFGLMEMNRLAHALESVLDAVRKGRRAADPVVIGRLLEGVDGLRQMCARVRGGLDEVDAPTTHEALKNALASLISHSGERITSVHAAAGLLTMRLDPADTDAHEALHLLRQAAVPAPTQAAPSQPATALAGGDGPADDIRAILAGFTEGLLDQPRITRVTAGLARLRDESPDDIARSLYGDLLSTVSAFVDSVGFDRMLRDHILDRLPSVIPSAPSIARSGTSSRERTDRIAGVRTVRVSETAVDAVFAEVGSLVELGDLYVHVLAGLRGRDDDLARRLRQANQGLEAATRRLQEATLAIRQVPLGPTLQKVPRLVRDVAARSGKEIEVEIEGEGVLVDKGLIETIDAPLTHLTRNAADHGVETPERRKAAGKPALGRIRIVAQRTKEAVTITISDDGAGLDLAAIRRKAESLGLVSPADQLDEQATMQLIFASGLSTAQQVSDVSGRGVGMDVVKRSVEDAGGSITIASQRGAGSTFTLRLPVGTDTRIFDGYLLRLGGERFVLPLDRVGETFVVRPSELGTMPGGGACVIRHDQVLAVIPGHQAVCGQAQPWPQAGFPVVTLRTALGRALGVLSVDETLGVQRLVGRPLPPQLDGQSRFTGTALLGDGSLALVLDPERLAR